VDYYRHQAGIDTIRPGRFPEPLRELIDRALVYSPVNKRLVLIETTRQAEGRPFFATGFPNGAKLILDIHNRPMAHPLILGGQTPDPAPPALALVAVDLGLCLG